MKLLKTDNKNGIKAQLEIHKDGPSGPKAAKIWVRQGDDLYVKSGEHESYRDGYIVQNIYCTPDSEYIEFNQGRFLELGEESGGAGDDIITAPGSGGAANIKVFDGDTNAVDLSFFAFNSTSRGGVSVGAEP